MTNWFTKVAQWKDRDFDGAEHVRKAFESAFHSFDPSHSEMDWPPPDTIFLDARPEAKHTYVHWGKDLYNPKYNQKYQVQSIALFANERYYKVEINNGPIHDVDIDNPTNVPRKDDARLWVTAHGFRGELARIYDSITGNDHRTFPSIIAKDPLDFVNQVADLIRSDKRRDDNEGPDEPEPTQPDPTPVSQNSPVLV